MTPLPGRKPRSTVTSLMMAAALVAVAGAAFAAPPQRASMAACRADLASLCPGLEAGGGGRMRCLADNQAKLSPACGEAVTERRAARAGNAGATVLTQAQVPGQSAVPPSAVPLPAAPARGGLRACRTDLASLCATVEAGGGRKLRCLADNSAKLSPECTRAVALAQENAKATAAACRDDARTYCSGMKGPERLQCLSANKAHLTADCAAVVARREARAARSKQ